MATRKIKDAKDLSTQELIYFKGHAKATFMSDGATVEDAVRAVENATYKNKGYFPTLAELQSAFPEGSAGSRAYVGSTYPYSIYLWQNGAWVDSGATGGDESVDLGGYYTKDEVDAKVTELSDSVELFKATTTKYEYGLTLNNYLNGSINSMGQVASYGKRTEPLQVKKGDIIQGKKFNGTPAYAYLSRLNEDGTYTVLFVPKETGVSEFSYTADNDMSVVFSTSSAAIEVIISQNKVYDQIYENNQKINNLEENVNESLAKIEADIEENVNESLAKIEADIEENVNESLAKIEADIEEISKELEPLKGEAQTLNFHYTEMLQGAVSYGAITNYGRRTEPIAVKKGDTIIASGFSGTPAYDFASEWKDGVYVKALYIPNESVSNQDFTLAIDEDKEIVFSTSSANITIEIQGSNVITALQQDIEKLQQDIEKKPSAQDFNFFGFAVDTTTSVYEYNRQIDLPNFALKAGSSFVLQTGEVLYYGYADSERVATINVNGTGAKRIFLDGTLIQPKYSWEKGDLLFMYFDGEVYQATGLFGQSKANALWSESIGTSAIDLYDTSEEVDSPHPSYFACKVSVTKGTILFINTFCPEGVEFLSKILADGTIEVLERGNTAYKGYKIDMHRYLYEVKEDMVLRITYSKQNRPKIISFNSYMTQFIESAKTSIADLLRDIATKANITEVNAKASAADLAAETAAREAAILELQRQINEFDFSGDIESVVKDYIAEHPEVVTSIQDNTITEAKFTESVRHKKPSIYTNVAEMIADTTLEVGMTAITKGYYAENDGGAGQYTIVARQTENGGSYISLNNGLTASLNFDGKTYILSQWGVRGDGELRTARSVYPFLTTSAIKETNDHFDDSVSDATYMIQYLMNLSRYRNCDIVIDGKVYKITHTIFVQPMVTLRGCEDGAPRSNWIELQQFYYCNSSLVLIKAGIPMFAGDKFFDTTGNGYSNIQLLCMKNFNARGVFGTDIEGDAGSFLDTKNMSLTRSLFKHLNLAGFGTGFNIIEQCYWTIFDTLNLYRMRDNGIYMGYNEDVETSGQKNANSIMNCVIFGCGMDYDKSSKQYVNKYGATSDAANRLPINKPTPNRGNCIVVSYSGNYISNCDVSDAAVGVYRAAYSNGTTIVGLYSEEISMAQIYNDYTSGNVDSAELGGYLRVDKWTDTKGNERQNIRVANPNDFVE